MDSFTDEVVDRVGFEPTTNGLRVHCSIPLSYRSIIAFQVPGDRIELPSARCKRAALPLDEPGLVPWKFSDQQELKLTDPIF